MSTICSRCALRLQRAAQADGGHASKRAFSQSTASRKHHGVPVFTPTSNPDLHAILTSMRDKHFVPAYLSKPERRLIFGTKHMQQLQDNPQSVMIGDDEIPLKWIDRRKEIPNRTKLFHRAIGLMAEEPDASGWRNLSALLTGLQKAKATPEERAMGKVVRKAVNGGRIGVIVQCLRQAEHTGMTLLMPEVLDNVIWGLHKTAAKDGWSEGDVAKALKDAKQIAILLETEEHGGGSGQLRAEDARRKPEVIGVFLELAAVHAYKFQGGKDIDGTVKMFAERLLDCIGSAAQPPSHAPPSTGPVYEMLHGVPIFHGLYLADKILGNNLPKRDLATKIKQDYEAGLKILADAIEAQGAKPESYGEQALKVWRDVIRE